MQTLTRIVSRGLAALILGAFSWGAQAQSVTWDFIYNITDGTTTGPVASLTLTDDGSGGTDFTVTNDPTLAYYLGSNSNLTRVWFSSSTSVSAGEFSSSSIYDPTLDTSPSGTQGYNFNLQVNLNTAPPKLTNGLSSTWNIAGHSVADFMTLATGGNNGPDTYAMVQIQGTTLNGLPSYHYVSEVPEPNTYLLMGVGLGLMGLLIRRRLNT